MIAAAANTVLYVVARLAGLPLELTEVFSDQFGRMPVHSFVLATLLEGGAVGTMAAAACQRWAPRPRTSFVALAVVGTIASFWLPGVGCELSQKRPPSILRQARVQHAHVHGLDQAGKRQRPGSFRSLRVHFLLAASHASRRSRPTAQPGLGAAPPWRPARSQGSAPSSHPGLRVKMATGNETARAPQARRSPA